MGVNDRYSRVSAAAWNRGGDERLFDVKVSANLRRTAGRFPADRYGAMTTFYENAVSALEFGFTLER